MVTGKGLAAQYDPTPDWDTFKSGLTKLLAGDKFEMDIHRALDVITQFYLEHKREAWELRFTHNGCEVAVTTAAGTEPPDARPDDAR